MASLNSRGTASEVKAYLKSSIFLEMRVCPVNMYNLPGMASDPGTLPIKRALTTLLTSSTVWGVGEAVGDRLWPLH